MIQRSAMVYPMAFYVFYIASIGVLTFKARKGAVQRGEVDPRYFKCFQGQEPPQRVVVVGRHYNNQFELPLLFLLTCVVYMTMDWVDIGALLLAWAFIVTRIFHSRIHLGHNHPLQRARAFALGWLVILAQWAYLLVQTFSHSA
jgi:hypothetical protein